MVLWLRQMSHDQEVVSSNPGTIHWMDVSVAKLLGIDRDRDPTKEPTFRKLGFKIKKNIFFFVNKYQTSIEKSISINQSRCRIVSIVETSYNIYSN